MKRNEIRGKGGDHSAKYMEGTRNGYNFMQVDRETGNRFKTFLYELEVENKETERVAPEKVYYDPKKIKDSLKEMLEETPAPSLAKDDGRQM